MKDSISIKFFGAARCVAGSKYLLRTAGNTTLIDRGLFQGLKERIFKTLISACEILRTKNQQMYENSANRNRRASCSQDPKPRASGNRRSERGRNHISAGRNDFP